MLYYLNDSAACPKGDLPWSSIEISASPEYVDASFWMSPSHMRSPALGEGAGVHGRLDALRVKVLINTR